MIELRRFTSARDFLALAGPFLEAREAEHCFLLGLCTGQPDAWFVAALDDGQVAGAALCTPPHRFVLSEMTEPVALALADAIPDELPGVLGPVAIARAFVLRRARATTLEMRERVFGLERLVPPRPAPGAWRFAEPRDRDTLAAWGPAYVAEVYPGTTLQGDPVAQAERWIQRVGKAIYLWDDGEPVAMAAAGGETAHGIRIGPVYTPPAVRGHGYASNVVAAATQDQLARGRRFCCLATDLANPTSNRIYQALGYEPVTDLDQYRFR